MKNRYLFIILILYSVLILRLIVFKYPPGMTFSLANANFIPFKTILFYLSGEPTWKIAIRNLLGNVVVLIPFGFLFAIQYNNIKWYRVLLLGLLAGAVLELLQVIFRSGIVDIDDIILNSLGVVVGYLFYIFSKFILRKFKIFCNQGK